MNLDARFRMLVFGQVVLGIAAFCLAEENLVLMIVAGSLALASWYFAEGPRGRPLPRWLVNAGSLAAMAVMLLEVSARDSKGLIVAMGHFTMALQILMLYARKTNREYSMLLVLSLIQMIGASVLSVSIVYGVLLATYCGLALVTVLLFQIKATGDGVHQRRVATAHRAGVDERPRRPAVVSGRGMRGHLRGAWAGIGVLSAVLAAGVFVVLPRSGNIPALGVQTRGDSGHKRTGFSPTVSLAGGAPRDGSTDAVLNLAVEQFGDNAGGDHRAFLLRGAALDYYDTRAHQWRRGPMVAQAERPQSLPPGGVELAELEKGYAAVDATVTLRDPSPRVLFIPTEPQMSGGAVSWIDSPHLEQIAFNPVDRQVFAGEPKTSAITYQVSIAGLPDPGVQPQYEALPTRRGDGVWLSMDGAPAYLRGGGDQRWGGGSRRPLSAWWRSLTRLPWVDEPTVRLWRGIWRRSVMYAGGAGQLGDLDRGGRGWEPDWLANQYGREWSVQTQRVRELTLAVLAEAGEGLTRDPADPHGPDDARIATVLAEFLRNNFAYSLSNPRAQEGTDPVIGFLFDHRSGHCELFASALAVMCRSINIPARVITGYRASEYNSLGGYYVVRQTHAHAWTEVDCGPGIGWRTYDATPAAPVRAEHAAAGPGWFAALRQVYEYLEFTWVRSVVAYDERTRQSLLQSLNTKISRTLTGDEGLPARLLAWGSATFGSLRVQSVGAALVLAGSVLLAIAGASIAVAVWRRRRQRATLRLDRMPAREARRMSRQLHFYLDLLDRLERHGYRRPAWQSPAAYARALESQHPELAPPVTSLVDSFYRVRFGRIPLNAAQQQQVQSDLRRLDAALAARR